MQLTNIKMPVYWWEQPPYGDKPVERTPNYIIKKEKHSEHLRIKKAKRQAQQAS